MKFKNRLEEKTYNITNKIFKDSVTIEHNKIIRIEKAIFPEVASFSGPPKKEIDVITAKLRKEPHDVSILISCKDFTGYKAEPCHVQEWGSVIETMNKYSSGTLFLGMILCPSGFTNGCEPWATSSNMALIPPLKGKIIKFSEVVVFRMFERCLLAFNKRLSFESDNLFSPPNFYNFCYDLTSDFEGYDEAVDDRYELSKLGWKSSFGELVSLLIKKRIEDVVCTKDYILLNLEEGLIFRYYGEKIIFGEKDTIVPEENVIPTCKKNLSYQQFSFKELQKLVIGKKLSSAADFGTHFEFGINKEMNLGFYPNGMLHIVLLNNPQ